LHDLGGAVFAKRGTSLQSPNITTFTSPGVEILFQSARSGLDAGLTKRLIDFIDGTEHSLDVAIYDLRHPAILEALARQTKRGVRLRLAYDGGKERAGGLSGDPKPAGTEEALAAAGLLPYATAVHEAGRHLMHDKFVVRDGKAVWVGSANFTIGGLEQQDNNCLILTSNQLATCYTTVLEELLQAHHAHTHESATPPTIEVGNTPLIPFFEPASGDGVGRAITAALRGARRVRIAAFLLSDAEILKALLPFAGDPHADIRGVYDPNGMKDVLRYTHQDPQLFWFLNDPRFCAAPSHGFVAGHEQDFMHNKVFVIEDQVVFTGSYNFSENARENDETVLALNSTAIAAAYTSYIERLYTIYKADAVPAPAAIVRERSAAAPSTGKAAGRVAAVRETSRSRASGLDRAISFIVILLVIVLLVAVLLAILVLHSG
jgi:phosphatidylserine/phosphatidylglycerophosphate/cardiolipin synthase-like enzyme